MARHSYRMSNPRLRRYASCLASCCAAARCPWGGNKKSKSLVYAVFPTFTSELDDSIHSRSAC
jgi:hypothetical protein